MRSARLFDLLEHLRGRTLPVTAAQLARQFAVSERTIYRDIASLQALGAPIRGEAGFGYLLERGTFLPPLRFDGDELDAVMLGLQWAAAHADPDLAAGARRVAGKLRTSLPDEDGHRLLARPLRQVEGQAAMAPGDAAHFAALRRATSTLHKVELAYRRADGTASRRIVRPLGLFAFGPVWLLAAWCETRDDFRNFRLDRIDRLTVTESRFRPERGRRLEDLLSRM